LAARSNDFIAWKLTLFFLFPNLAQSTAKLDDLTKDSRLDPSNVSKMICLPSIARHEGVALHCSPTPNPFLTSMFEALGGVVTLKTEKELEACMMTTCVMGPMYGIMRQGRDWLMKQTELSQEEASYLVIKQYIGIVQDAERDLTNPNRLDDLIEEQTPGGVNAQALANLEKQGGLDAQTKVMDAILSRIRGESDGST
jgi:pyrroline-5-carboxylate reductase